MVKMKSKTSKLTNAINSLAIGRLISEDVDLDDVELDDVDSEDVGKRDVSAVRRMA
jgi:hypothetical protein